MSLIIRQWLEERNIELNQLGRYGLGQGVRSGAHLAGIAFQIVQDMEVKSLTPFDVSILAELLELPLPIAAPMMEILCQLSQEILRVLSQRKPLKRNEGTWLVYQVAYLLGLQRILEQELSLRRPWLNRAIIPLSVVDPLHFSQSISHSTFPKAPNHDYDLLNDPSLQALIKTLRPGRLSDTQAEQALLELSESLFVKQMNNLGVAWLMANGAEAIEAKLLGQRLLHSFPGYLLSAIAQNPLPLAQLQKFVRLGIFVGSKVIASRRRPPARAIPPDAPTIAAPRSAFDSSDPGTAYDDLSNPILTIHLQREQARALLQQSLNEPLFGECFALSDLYVPLKAKPISGSGSDSTDYAGRSSPEAAIDLWEWMCAQLADIRSLVLLEGLAGSGKSSFCQIFAARMSQSAYPTWMPILIRLRDVTLGQTLEQTLESAFPLGRFTDVDGWLSPEHPPCLFLLDGLDELPSSPQTPRHRLAFLAQVVEFQTRQLSLGKGYPRHKIIVTSRRLANLWEGQSQKLLDPLLPYWKRVVIQPFEQDEFRHWFKQWSKLQSKAIAQAYFAFLKQNGVFHAQGIGQHLAGLIRQPLSLYLLGLLHRDGLLDESICQMDLGQMKFEIYDRICHWLLGEAVSETGMMPVMVKDGLAHAYRSQEAIANLLFDQSPQAVRTAMQKTALKILQSGSRPLTLEEKAAERSQLPRFFFHQSLVKLPLLTQQYRLADWMSQSYAPIAGSSHFDLTFSHGKLGEYLCALEIAAQLQSLTQRVKNAYGEWEYVWDTPQAMAQHLYTLLGYGVMTPEIEELVIEQLQRQSDRNPGQINWLLLFERLLSFYRAYCRGRWMDEGLAHQSQTYFRSLHNPVTVLQIEAAVGLNVFVLLCALTPLAQQPFFPCGKPQDPLEFDAEALQSLLGRTRLFAPNTFWQRIHHKLNGIQLPKASLMAVYLPEANLSQANLAQTELCYANLAGANLQAANLAGANLSGANLQGANLNKANFSGADLAGATLQAARTAGADFSYSCLFQTELDEQTRILAYKNGAFFTREEFQAYRLQQALKLEIPVSYLGEEDEEGEPPTQFVIQSAEGEAIAPEGWTSAESEEPEDETVMLPTQSHPDADLSEQGVEEEDATALLEDYPVQF